MLVIKTDEMQLYFTQNALTEEVFHNVLNTASVALDTHKPMFIYQALLSSQNNFAVAITSDALNDSIIAIIITLEFSGIS